MNFSATAGDAARAAARCSAPVNSEVSPKQPYKPSGTSLSYMAPTLGQDANPVVVSLSPHLAATQSVVTAHSSRTFADAQCTNSFALREAPVTVAIAPSPPMQHPTTGLQLVARPP